MVGEKASSEGSKVYYLASGDKKWQQTPHITAARIALDSKGHLWTVNSLGNVFRSQETGAKLLNSRLQAMPGKAQDIGTGGDGSIWVISTKRGVYRWNTANNQWQRLSGIAIRIDVDPNGIPWVVNRKGNLYSGDFK